MRIAILGGSFDPIHNGHLQIAKEALKQLAIDEVWFMPAKDTPLKEGQCAAYHDRCNMVELAIRPYRHMKICYLEGELSGRSYTIRTLNELRKRYPSNQFCWLIGDDQAKQFYLWKDSDQLKKEANFYVFSREETLELEKGLQRVVMPLIDISSTDIRNGHKLYYVPKTVRRYMGRHGLYLETMVASYMSEKRFRHSLSVAKLCSELAEAHHLDKRKAYIAGVVHDMCKQLPYEQAYIWMKYHMNDHLDETAAIWHGYIGAYYAKHVFYIEDSSILRAVFHHVKGRNINDYERILFIADKLDPSRGYDSSKQIALCKRNLKKGYEQVKKEQEEYLRKEKEVKK